MYSVLRAIVFATGAFVSGAVLSASPVTWNLQDVVFDNQIFATGSFVFDADTGVYSDLHITTSGGGSIPTISSWAINTANPVSLLNTNRIAGFEAVDVLSADESSARVLLFFTTLGPLTNAGGTIAMNRLAAGACGDATCGTVVVALDHGGGTGEITSEPSAATNTPEPGSLLLIWPALVCVLLFRRFPPA